VALLGAFHTGYAIAVYVAVAAVVTVVAVATYSETHKRDLAEDPTRLRRTVSAQASARDV